MAKTPQAIRGTQDIFGPDAEAFAHVVETFERVRKLYRFRRVEMPVFERTEVFSRAIGETTDVVSKEMYSFEDRGGESLTLRPEFTAGIARAYLSNGWQQHAPIKLATHGPLFRYERPQKGRYRQFHQIDAEIIGAAEPQADVELLAMADQLLRELGIEGVTLHLNTLGDGDSREAWRAALVEYFRDVQGELSEDSQERLEKNPLRILDSKDRRDRKFVADAPKIDQFLSDDARAYFDDVTSGLDAAGVKWQRAESLRLHIPAQPDDEEPVRASGHRSDQLPHERRVARIHRTHGAGDQLRTGLSTPLDDGLHTPADLGADA